MSVVKRWCMARNEGRATLREVYKLAGCLLCLLRDTARRQRPTADYFPPNLVFIAVVGNLVSSAVTDEGLQLAHRTLGYVQTLPKSSILTTVTSGIMPDPNSMS